MLEAGCALKTLKAWSTQLATAFCLLACYRGIRGHTRNMALLFDSAAAADAATNVQPRPTQFDAASDLQRIHLHAQRPATCDSIRHHSHQYR